MVPSRLPLARTFPSGEKATARTLPLCPSRTLGVGFPGAAVSCPAAPARSRASFNDVPMTISSFRGRPGQAGGSWRRGSSILCRRLPIGQHVPAGGVAEDAVGEVGMGTGPEVVEEDPAEE